MNVLMIPVPPSHPRETLDDHRTRLFVRFGHVFNFDRAMLRSFAAGDGWRGWLLDHGYDPDAAEAVHFDPVPGGGPDQIVMLLGARSKVVQVKRRQP